MPMHARLTIRLLGLVTGLLLVTLLALAACDPLHEPPPVREQAAQQQALALSSLASPAPPPATHTFHVASHGWHTSIIVPAADLIARLPQLAQRFPNRRFLEIGWGDAGFYQAKDITVGIALEAMFVPTTAVVHVVGFDDAPEHHFAGSEVVAIVTPAPAYADLLSYLSRSFHQTADGALVAQGAGLYDDAQFYTGVGQYTLLNTCNKWSAKALYSAGLDIHTRFKLTASSVMRSVQARHGTPAHAATPAVPVP